MFLSIDDFFFFFNKTTRAKHIQSANKFEYFYEEAIHVCPICEVDSIETNAHIMNIEVIHALENERNVRLGRNTYIKWRWQKAYWTGKERLEPALKCEVEVTNVHWNGSDASTSNANPDNLDADPPVAFTNETI